MAYPRTIPAHIHGYPGVAFGGYVAGLLADRANPSAQGHKAIRVDFRRTIAVETPILLTAPTPDGHVRLTSTDHTLLAEASPAELTVDPIPAPSWAAAKAATETALSSPSRTVTDCYGCGVAAPRGLRIFPWALHDRPMVAAAWTPSPSLADESGNLPPEVVWAALDCPSGIAAWARSGMTLGAFTAALTATQLRPLPAGADYIAHAWPLHREGRKHTVAVALSTPDGDLCALAETLWLDPKPEPTA
ncbi:PaaI family thioesterase [Nocardia jejuensis]|uniref:PaaI family thioesterase n=1 Tax=Nocardia jejuensis TaxID=328049 RepID=UPI00082A962D|nr:hypothetical protein [Nocardia jejuensis]